MGTLYDIYHKDPAFAGKPLARMRSNGKVVKEFVKGSKKIIEDMMYKLKRGIMVEESLDYSALPVRNEKRKSLFQRFGNFSKEVKDQYRFRSKS